MNYLNEEQAFGTECNGSVSLDMPATPSPEFLHDLAELLEIGPDDDGFAPVDISPEAGQREYIQPNGGMIRCDTSFGRGDPRDLPSWPQPY